MKNYTIEQFQNDFDNMLNRVENGESIAIVNDDGQKVVMMPVDNELYKMYIEMNNEAS